MIKLQCKSWFDPKDLVYIIERYNPFAFKDKEGRLLLFKDYTAAYRYTLKQLAKRFPKGYIDMIKGNCTGGNSMERAWHQG